MQQPGCTATSIQQVEMIFVALLAGATTVAQTGTTLRVDPARHRPCGLPGGADQSVLADTLTAATDQDVADRRGAVDTILQQHRQVWRHAFAQALLVLDLDRSPGPTRPRGEGVDRGYRGRSRATTGRPRGRGRAATGATLWAAVLPGRAVAERGIVQAAVRATERLLGRAGDTDAAHAKRARLAGRRARGWGRDAIRTGLLARGDQVTATVTSSSRGRTVVRPRQAWPPTSRPGRQVAPVPTPVALAPPTRPYAGRTPAQKKAGGSPYAVVLTRRSDLGRLGTVDHDDARAAVAAELKGDTYGLGLGVLRTRTLAAPRVRLRLGQRAPPVLLWARPWLAAHVPRRAHLGSGRLVRAGWAIPGRVTLVGGRLQRVRLRPAHPRARAVCAGLRTLLAPRQIALCLAET